MFWGLTMEAQKRYTQTVVESFHVSHAVLDVNSVTQETSPTQVVLEFESNNYLLANLSKSAKIFQVPLDLNFQKGDRVSFRTIGTGTVHLSGYHMYDDEDDLASRLMDGDESDEDDDEEEEMMGNSISYDSPSAPPGKRKKLMSGAANHKKTKLEDSDDDEDDEEAIGSTLGESTLLDLEAEEDSDEDDNDDEFDEDEDDDEDEDEEDSEEEEEEEEQKVPAKNAIKSANKNTSINGETPGKKSKLNTSQKEIPKTKTPKSEKKSKSNLNQSTQEKTPKQDGKTPKKDKKTPAGSPASPGQKKVLEGGVIAEELKVGEGPVAKSGKTAQVYYIGRLKSNNKQFDATSSGPGFKFRIGRGEVIRGWDIGVAGMRVGGKRRLTVPAGLAYGAKGSPPVIPANATLVFDVELRGVS